MSACCPRKYWCVLYLNVSRGHCSNSCGLGFVNLVLHSIVQVDVNHSNYSLKLHVVFFFLLHCCFSSDVIFLFLHHQNHPVCDAAFGCSGDDCQEKYNFSGSINWFYVQRSVTGSCR